MSEIKVDSIGPRVDSGTLTIGAAGDTVNIAGTAGTGFPAGVSLSGSTNNTVATVTGANALIGEANLTFDGSQLNIPTGSAGAPSLAHTGDPDTGIYFATNQINFATTGQNRVELLSDGNLSIRQENIKFETADKGIYLGTTTGAASNLLNDYEFGTFTPAFEPTNNSFTTKGGVAGYYTKIGKMVYAQVHLNVTTNGSASGNINVTNFPFNSADVGLTHTINRGRETQIDGSAFDVIMSRNVTAMVILAPPFGNGASYDLNTMYRVA